jgi:hypothetical protein
MKIRLFKFLFCTALSCWGLVLSWIALSGLFNALFFEPLNFTYTKDNIILEFVLCTLIWSAWFYYFKISIKWIKYNYVEKLPRIIGATLGITCILITGGYGLFIALPSIILMLYIHYNVPYDQQA